MGLFSWIGDKLRNVFGIKKKESEMKEEPEIRKIEVTKEEPEVREVIEQKPVEKLKSNILGEDYEQPKEKERIKIEKPVPKAPSIKDISKRQEVEKIANDLNNNGELKATKWYNSSDELRKNKFDIYRNVIMGAIKDENTAVQIYRSGVLKDRIVGRIIIEGVNHTTGQYFSNASNPIRTKALTPDLVLDEGVYEFLRGWSGSFEDFTKAYGTKLKGLGGNSVLEGLEHLNLKSGDNFTVEKVSISFDFA